MYHSKSHFSVNPRNIGGLMEDVINNGWNRIFFDDEREFASVPVNANETDNSFELQVIAPGLKKEDFKLNIEKNVLTISFEQKEEAKDETTKWLRKEYKFRSFKRSFTLNEKISTSGITAKYNDGILNISLPKKENTEPTAQEITVG